MKKKLIRLIILTLLVIISIYGVPKIAGFIKSLIGPLEKVDVVKYFPFSEEKSLREWEEKIFKGRVLYSIDKEDHQSFVLGASTKTASAMYYKIKLNMDKKPIISWKWNAQKFPDKGGSENLKDAKQDDFVGRVYVIFPALFFTNSKALEYIWTESVPEGTISPSPYSKNLQLFVVETGKKEGGGWVSEQRNIYEDYIKAFGSEPKLNIGAIAFMTDADSTGSTAESFFDDIKIGYQTTPQRTE